MFFSYRTISLAVLLLLAGKVGAAEITVSAAASLTNAFKDIASEYEKQHPSTKIRLNTAGSGALLQQALKGAPVDVLAFADEKTMDMAADKKVINPSTRHTFARNALVIAAPINSKLRVKTLADLKQSSIQRIAISNPNSVPVGRYSKAALEKAHLWDVLQPKVINTQHVRQSLDYIARGEVDTGFVYRTDAVLRKDKVKILATIPTTTPVSYPLAVASGSNQPDEALKFSQFVRSPKGKAILSKYGFLVR